MANKNPSADILENLRLAFTGFEIANNQRKIGNISRFYKGVEHSEFLVMKAQKIYTRYVKDLPTIEHQEIVRELKKVLDLTAKIKREVV